MDWELVKPWVNRVGILLEFLSFWFAAPEILGEERLRALERRVEREIEDRLLVLPAVLLWALVFIVIVAIRKSRPEVELLFEGWDSSTDLVVGAPALVFALIWILLKGTWRALALTLVLALAATLCVLALAGWTNVRIWILLVIAWAIWLGAILATITEFKITPRVLRVLTDDQRIRQRSLAVGAVLFVVGFLLQLVTTF